jgi:ribonuclease HI
MCVLANKHIGGSGQCPVCEWGAEDIAHMLFKCDRAKEVWEALGIYPIIGKAADEDRSGSVVLEILLRPKHPMTACLGGLDVKEVIATAAWFIWWRRRELKHKGTAPIPSRLALSIKAMVANSNRAKKNRSGLIKKGWTKPLNGMVKINTDTAVDLAARTASTGCIIRDSHGQFLAACRVEIEGVINVITAEAQAVRDGLCLAERIGCNNSEVETDCLEVVTVFQYPLENRIVGTTFLDECRTMMAGFNSSVLRHCPREANKAVDFIASSVEDRNYNLWLENPPIFLYPQFVDDVTLI